MAGVDERLSVRFHDQYGRYTFKTFGDPELRGNLEILVELSHIDADHLEMRRQKRFQFRQLHDVRQYDAVAAPVSAEIDQYALTALARSGECRANRCIRVGAFDVGMHLHYGKVMDVRELHHGSRCGARRKGNEHRNANSRQTQPLRHAASPRPSSSGSMLGSRPRNRRYASAKSRVPPAE